MSANVAEKQILIAAVGNLWKRDDGFGTAVARRLREHEQPSGVSVADFGTSGLDLAYEVMRGYAALVLVDVTRQGGAPGTLYVMEADPESVELGIEDGDIIDPHDMDPRTVLRFVKAVNGWPGKVVVIGCEPMTVDDYGIGLSPEVEAAVDTAVKLVGETVAELQSGA
jgi:hydrogenase maturation protease